MLLQSTLHKDVSVYTPDPLMPWVMAAAPPSSVESPAIIQAQDESAMVVLRGKHGSLIFADLVMRLRWLRRPSLHPTIIGDLQYSCRFIP